MSRRLECLTWTEIGASATVVLPIGSLEQHGPHLPLNTDVVIAEAVATGVFNHLSGLVARPDQVVLAPALTYTASGEHEGFAGTISIGVGAVRLVLVELARSARRWADRLVLVNAHGGNAFAIRDATTQLRAEGHQIDVVTCGLPGADLHAGRTETSLMLHLAPAAVRTDRVAAGYLGGPAEAMPVLRRAGVAALSASGVLGDPRAATAAEGATVLADMTRRACAALGNAAAGKAALRNEQFGNAGLGNTENGKAANEMAAHPGPRP